MDWLFRIRHYNRLILGIVQANLHNWYSTRSGDWRTHIVNIACQQILGGSVDRWWGTILDAHFIQAAQLAYSLILPACRLSTAMNFLLKSWVFVYEQMIVILLHVSTEWETWSVDVEESLLILPISLRYCWSVPTYTRSVAFHVQGSQWRLLQ